MSYTTISVSLSNGQKEKLARSFKKSAPVTIRLASNQTNGSDRLIVTETIAKRLAKARASGNGVDIKLSQAGIRKQSGAGWLSALMPVAKKMLTKTVMPLAKKAIGPLASGALSGLSSWTTGKILGSGQAAALGGGLFSIPQDKIDKLIKYKSYMTEKQRAQLLDALQTGSGIPRFQLTKSQRGGFLGTLVASLVVPELLKAFTGGGYSKGGGFSFKGAPTSQRSVYVPRKKGGSRSFKKSRHLKGKGLILGKHSPFKGIPILGDIL